MPIHCTTFMELRWRLRVVYLIHANVKCVFERKFVPKNGGFWSKKGCKAQLLVLRPPKGTSLRGTAFFDVFCVKIRAGVLAVDDLKNPKKRTISRVSNFAHAQKRNPLSDLDEMSQDGRYPRHNHVGKFCWRSVKGFRGGGGSHFGISHWLWSSSFLALPCECVITAGCLQGECQ